MLAAVGYASMDEFIDACVPESIRIKELGDEDVRPFSELEFLRRAEWLAGQNKGMKSYIGMG
jgi:glycine dehydrogenase